MKTPPVHLSIVIIGRNEGSRLLRCFDSVARAKGAEGAEVIYVDSASSDDSVQAGLMRGVTVLQLQSSRPTAAAGRNLGWRAAQGEFILFLDGDTILDEHFLPQALREFRTLETAIVWGHRREMNPSGSIYNRVLDLDWLAPAGITDSCGGDALMRRSALERVGGYDESLIAGEEPEMCRRLRACGSQIVHIDTPMTRHDLAITSWKQYWKRAIRTGHAYREVSDRYRGTEMPLWEREARGNLTRAAALLLLGLLALATAWFSQSLWPLAAAAAIVAFLSVRSALKFRWKCSDPGTALLYGLHSHVQQIPILVGQLQCLAARTSGHRRELIEYKDAPR